jgi:hypothetical protein
MSVSDEPIDWRSRAAGTTFIHEPPGRAGGFSFGERSPLFYVGLHQPHQAAHVTRCCLSVARLWRRQQFFTVGEWMLDSAGFSALQTGRGAYPANQSPAAYAEQIRYWSACGRLVIAVSQDWICTPEALCLTGLTAQEHQRRTIARYEALLDCDTANIPLMPVLQGQSVGDYLRHLDAYGYRLAEGAWVGVGALKAASTQELAQILLAIRWARPDLRLHGFGVGLRGLANVQVRRALWSCDSMAWSLHARLNGGSPNDVTWAQRYMERAVTIGAKAPSPLPLFATLQ